MIEDDCGDAHRRHFLRMSGGALGASWLGLQWSAVAAAAAHAHAAVSVPPPAFGFLDAAQGRDVAAIAACIVPSGATPGASEAGVVYFIDHIHQHAFGAQAATFKEGLAGFQAAFAAGRPAGAHFADADPQAQSDYLRGIESTPFFASMRQLTILGLLSLPGYGGNRDKLGWKLVGFDDRHIWEPPFGHYDAQYKGFQPYAPVNPPPAEKPA